MNTIATQHTTAKFLAVIDAATKNAILAGFAELLRAVEAMTFWQPYP